MQSPFKSYATSQFDAPVWADWMKPNRANNSSWDSSLVASLTTHDSDESSDVIEGSSRDTAIPVGYTWTPPTPALDSDDNSSSSQLSIESPSLSSLSSLPEIPFISTANAFESIVNTETDADGQQYDFDAVGSTVDERTFWASIIRPNHSHSRSTPAAVLGQTNQRVLSANRCRSPSVSSTASTSSRSRPPPAKSILSSGSSVRTCKGRKSPSVKFLDAPTIHYGSDIDEDEDDRNSELFDQSESPSSSAGTSKQSSGILGFLRRIVGSSPPLPHRNHSTPRNLAHFQNDPSYPVPFRYGKALRSGDGRDIVWMRQEEV
ncbi:hypothetical protein BXZ70DRAFT_1011711 [Cristinia sonorae]|uniref:Uncharacterized protein n=1 Tax=Cristinia sonorae TaxID=1940300 RepID=A0A8K0UI23_9AGAR|nr:hypothetical protein BXZ70DRAFT_1011711 [Cristinia sonorae]